ncbi:MAG: hypothetical protein MJZ16_11720 [Bacteroidales bacterium]|nr:hypothetical protein [Bacteroidales bacterium]
MKTRKFMLAALAAMMTLSASAQEGHVKISGFIRNYFTYDSRENVSGTEDLFMYVPKDESISANGTDLNAQSSFRFAALTSRLIVDATGYEYNGFKFTSKIEADFYNGVSGVTGTAVLRLRQAFVTMSKNAGTLKVGQAWHPMAADMPDIFSLNTGAPFGPFSRTPLAQFDYKFSDNFSLTASAIWQMQYTSAGPDGASANYIKYSGTPEIYAGVNYTNGGFIARLGLDMLSIKPRHNNGVDKVSDRITTLTPFAYVQYKADNSFTVKAKTVLAQAGEHVSLNGGYAVSAVSTDGSYSYTPTRNSSTWVSLSYGKKVQAILFGGYVKNFGTTKAVMGAAGVPMGYYFSKNSFNNMNQMFRVTPAVLCNLGKFSYGVEYEVTGVQYGDKSKGMNLEKGLYEEGLHWVTNHRLQGIVKFTF